MTNKFPINTTHKIIRSGRSLAHKISAPEKDLLEELPALRLDGKQFTQVAAIDEAIHQILEKFNLGVEAAFDLGGMQGLAEICTRGGLERMEQKFINWRRQDVKALILAECEFLAFNLFLEGSQARVFTFEKWGMVFENGKETWSQGEVDSYTLLCEDGQWKVDSVDFFSHES